MASQKISPADLLAGVIGAAAFALLAVPATTIAQDNDVSADDQTLEEIVVTGSRIARRDYISPSPISTIDKLDIDASSQATMEEMLNRMPQVMPDFGRAANNPGDGTARINLRGMGPERSLVLLNSRRLAPSGVGSAVDLNNIPQALIERVEIITGGASTVYGSDALAGVVNFITRDDFQGFSLEADYSVTGEGDANNYDINIAYGTDFAGGRGNVVFYGGYYERSELFAESRTITSQPLFENTETGTIELGGSSRTLGTAIVFPEVDYPSGPNWTTFNADGTPREFISPDDLYNWQPANYLQVPLQRYSAGIFGSYEMNSGFEWYLETSFARNNSAGEFASVPAAEFVIVNSDNPVLSPETRQLFEDNFLLAPGTAGIAVGRRLDEVGPRHSDNERDYWRTVLGLRGDLGGSWDIDGWVTYTDSDEVEFLLNDASASRFQQGLLIDPVTGQCFDPSNGCVPIDVFGPGRISPEAADFIRVPTMTNTSKRVQKLASVFVRGAPFDTWAGPVDIATGLEWRSDTAQFRADAGLFTGDTLGYFGDASVDGTESVVEVYAEAIVPLLSGVTGAQQLELEIGARYSDYENAGSAETYKLGGMWQPVDSVRFRVMGQRSVRAPNNLELFQEQFTFQGQYVGGNTADDPCSASADPVGNGHAERCIIQGLPASQIGVFEATSFFPTDFRFGGNPDLRPESADTLTVGVILTPTFMPNWNFSVDYYNMDMEGGIGEVFSDEVCFDQLNTGNLFCEDIRRGPTGDIVEIVSLFQNRGLFLVEGIDTQIDYVTDLPSSLSLFEGSAQIAFNIIWSHSLSVQMQENPVTAIIDCEGFFNSCGSENGTTPTNRVNAGISYMSGPMQARLGFYWIDGTVSSRTVEHLIFGGDELVLAIPSISSKSYFDLYLAYDFTDSISAGFGIANLLDEDPPFLADNTFDGTNTDTMMYDVFGRTFKLSFSLRLGN